MATHDYVIANGTGAAVRSDLNNALAAIVSNNSGSSEPGTTYAYQWWADTNANVLKIRNSSNDGWITLRELDGTMLIEDGSASTPGLAFADDVNTGIFSPAADQIGFATGGAERLEIGSSEVVFNDPSNDVDFRVESNGQTHMLFVDAGNDRVGIGVSSPDGQLTLPATASNTPALRLQSTTSDSDIAISSFADSTGSYAAFGANHYLDSSGNDAVFDTNIDSSAIVLDGRNKGAVQFLTAATGIAQERARIDSSGRLLLGTTSSEAFNGTPSTLQIEGTSDATTRISLFRTANDNGASVLVFAKARNTSHALLNNNDTIGKIEWYGADGNDTNQRAAIIAAEVDGSVSGNDMPGRLVFSTTADGASTPTERMRINSSGRVNVKSGDLRVTGAEGSSASLYLIADEGDDNGDGWRINSNQDDNDLTISNDDSGSFTDRMSIQSNGRVNMFNVYGTAIGGTTRDLHIEDGGQLGYVSSIRESKANISVLSDVDWIYQLQPSSFNYKLRDRDGEYTGEVSTELEYGLIAEDVEPIAPELCFYDEVDGEEELRGIHYKKLIVPMLKALQEAKAKITTLETKVAALEAG